MQSLSPTELDKLTQVARPYYLELFIAGKLAELQAQARSFGLILVDLDRLKMLNYSFGHRAGDAVLKMVAETMVKNNRPGDLVGRSGGQEFLWVLDGLEDEAQLFDLAERLRLLVADNWLTTETGTVWVTLSLGATLARPEDNVASLLERARDLMERSKAAGRNCTTYE